MRGSRKLKQKRQARCKGGAQGEMRGGIGKGEKGKREEEWSWIM